MRTDCNIYEWTKVRLPQIPSFSAGRKCEAERGDLVWWKFPEADFSSLGRVIASVTAHDFEGHYLIVASLLGSLCHEQWVDPAWVFDCNSLVSHDKLQWLFGPEFLKTPPDLARQCFDKLVSELIKVEEKSNDDASG